MKKLITFALIALFAATAGAATQTLAQKHAKAGVRGNPTQEQCIACHGGSYESLAKRQRKTESARLPHGTGAVRRVPQLEGALEPHVQRLPQLSEASAEAPPAAESHSVKQKAAGWHLVRRLPLKIHSALYLSGFCVTENPALLA